MNNVLGQDLSALKPDALTPAEIQAKTENVCVSKACMPLRKLLPLSMLAGMFIAFGAMYFCIVLGDSTLPFAIQRVLGGVCFCLGLILVFAAGAELFTGNVFLIMAKASGKISWGQLGRNWALVWMGNLVGALIAVGLLYMAHIGDLNSGGVGQAMVSVAVGKVTPEWITIFFKGILCNIFVCLGVWIAYSSRTVVDKVFGVLFPISAFVAAGFEHCVANMFFLPMGYILKLSGVAPEGLDLSALDIPGILYNLSAATVGNIIGGAVFIGMVYWFAFHKENQEKTA